MDITWDKSECKSSIMQTVLVIKNEDDLPICDYVKTPKYCIA